MFPQQSGGMNGKTYALKRQIYRTTEMLLKRTCEKRGYNKHLLDQYLAELNTSTDKLH